MGKLAEMFPEGSADVVSDTGIYPSAAELAKEDSRREKEKARLNTGPVKETVDFNALQKITVKHSLSPSMPTLTIAKNHIRLSGKVVEKFSDISDIRMEIRANQYCIAIKQNANGIQCRKEGGGGKRGIYIDRTEAVKQLADIGWQAGMVVELHWDEEGQFWWGRKPKEEAK